MLKVITIPPKQNESASQLVTVFCKLYEPLLKQATVAQQSSLVHPLLNDHMEAAFKLTIKETPHFKNRAFTWLASVVEEGPQQFWQDKKRRTVKSIYTHCVDLIKQVGDHNDPLREAKE